ncbi:MAG: exopolyphosphatase [Flavobacteriales bacterium]|jgi:exopolyphosphatase/guanosine-5'-triphosphate,3'-diphosphate pyrophosphatase|nr:exopolyphosphatase [Flavobacteriales bacterium]MBK7269995.1 exopolyphosphatase [Flavobacteriales bacterium]MBK9538395.1 exopolyphosphatase [Flavobacteriales bacterium]
MRVAVLDLGTNTFNLLVASRDGGEGLHVVHSEEIPVFLGKGGIEKGLITEDAFERGLDAIAKHMARARSLGAERIQGIGTSALRNARNAEAFIRAAHDRSGLHIRVISGDEEAELILEGARHALPFGNRPVLVMDIGGGSIEFILATEKALMWKQSFELGVTRLRERVPLSDPPALDEELRVAAHLDDRLEPLWNVIDRHEPHVLVGSAGSFDSLARMVADQEGKVLASDATTFAFDALAFDALKEKLLLMDRIQRLLVPGLPEHRVDSIAYGMIAIERVLTAGNIRELSWSRYALKEGSAMRLLKDQRPA